jgi:hypothetical protein
VRYYVVAGVAGACFVTGKRLTEIESGSQRPARMTWFWRSLRASSSVSDSPLMPTQSTEPGRGPRRSFWATSLELVGRLEIAVPATT